MENNIESSRKRKRTPEKDFARKLKQTLIETDVPESKRGRGLMDLSDEILLLIFKDLKAGTLRALGSSCKRLKDLVKDMKLWIVVDASDRPMTKTEIDEHILDNLTSFTFSLTIRGMLSYYPEDNWKKLTLTRVILNKITNKCPRLEVLRIIESTVDIQTIQIKDFPPNLKTLEFIDSESITPRRRVSQSGFFHMIDSHLKNLEKLSLVKCRWFQIHDVIAFSKIPRLRHLNLRRCHNFKDSVPYSSVSTRFGFHCLEVLDLRDTPVTDSDIQCFNITKSLRELYLDCPIHLRVFPNASRDTPNNDEARNNLIPHENISPNFDLVVVLPNSAPFVRPVVNNHNEAGSLQNAAVPAEAVNNENDGAPNRAASGGNDNESNMINLFLYRQGAVGMNPYYPISDRGILSYGRVRPQASQNLVYIRAAGLEERPEHTSLEVLYVRNYNKITNASLEHLAHCSPKLKLLDVSGTSVTRDGIAQFNLVKPECKVISNVNT